MKLVIVDVGSGGPKQLPPPHLAGWSSLTWKFVSCSLSKQEGNSLSDRPQRIIISQVLWVPWKPLEQMCSKSCRWYIVILDIYANVPQVSNPYRQNQANVLQTTTATINQMSSKSLPPQTGNCPPNHYRQIATSRQMSSKPLPPLPPTLAVVVVLN